MRIQVFLGRVTEKYTTYPAIRKTFLKMQPNDKAFCENQFHMF